MSVRRSARRALAAWVVAALLLAQLGCRGPSAPRWTPDSADQVARALGRAQELSLAGRGGEALELLEAASAQSPRDFAVAALLQDAREAQLIRGESVAGWEAWSGSPTEVLRRAYRAKALQTGDPFDFVMAARAEDDELAALHLLDEALARNGEEPLAHYGRAHVLLSLGRIGEARDALDRALGLAPGSLPARRLEARLLVALGQEREGLVALDAWLARTRTDPRVGPAARVDAQLEGAALSLRVGDAASALARLEGLDGLPGPLGARQELLRAAALDELGRYGEALVAAERAFHLNPDGLLALVYQALLLERRLDRADAAARAWSRVVDRASEPVEFDPQAALYLLRARVALARLEGRRDGGLR